MKCYDFTVYLKGKLDIDGEIADKLYAAGCDDGSPGSYAGLTHVTFHRDAESLEAAIASAVANIRTAGYDAERIEIDDEGIANVAG